MYTVDLNSDLGESFGNYKIGNDDKVIPLISSANVCRYVRTLYRFPSGHPF